MSVDFRRYHWPAGCREPEVYYDPRALEADPGRRAALHAKCIVIDRRELLVSSANFTEAAQARNIEVGLLVTSTALSGQVTDFFDGLMARNYVQRLSLLSLTGNG